MISESLKINTTLTTLNLSDDDKIMKMIVEVRKERVNKIYNEQLTMLEQKEQR